MGYMPSEEPRVFTEANPSSILKAPVSRTVDQTEKQTILDNVLPTIKYDAPPFTIGKTGNFTTRFDNTRI